MDDLQRWHHSPAHVFLPDTMYMVTAATLHKVHHFRDTMRLEALTNALFEVSESYGWALQAWAVFSNHYHFIAQSPTASAVLKPLIQRLHSQTARWLNRQDDTTGRQVWFQYWDTCLTYEKSYFARLNYVHDNPVKHGLVAAAEEYPFCSAGWFEAYADPSYYRKVTSFRYDRLKVADDF